MIEYGLLSRLQWEVTSLWTNWCDLECRDEDAFFSLSNLFDSHIWLYQLMDDYITKKIKLPIFIYHNN
jgi:hypothetical protein